MSEVLVKIDNLSFGYKASEILHEVSLCLERGEILGIVGPNGSGKSTLIKLISGLYVPWRGEVFLKDRPLASYSRKDIARSIASVSQEIEKDFPFTVREVVAMGRAPYMGRFAMENERDKAIIEEAMELTDISHYAERFPYQLSGGERQRMVIARALAQEPEILLMDEPTSHLDLNHQMEINSLIMRMKEEKGLAVVYVTHDLSSASECCSRIILLGEGQIHAEGRPAEVITAENINAVYGCRALVDENPETGRPRVTPLMRSKNV
jgi:iron complex transport system ATP-binding protein